MAANKSKIGKLKELIEIQLQDGNWNYSPYQLGMANGLLLAKSIMEGGKPDFLDVPEYWGQDSGPMSALSVLGESSRILEERGEEYDSEEGERSMKKTVEAVNIIIGKDITEAEGWLLMNTLKNVRQWQRPRFHRDSALDAVNYSALMAEALSLEEEEDDDFEEE